ncbi:MAG: hypothetical protein QHI48_04690, partial [Bacteroidota bacterium]|nr:hypothetical protein [Bacteroidota bacterium]
ARKLLCVDLADHLGMGRVQRSAGTRAILVQAGEDIVAFLVDAILELAMIPEGEYLSLRAPEEAVVPTIESPSAATPWKGGKVLSLESIACALLKSAAIEEKHRKNSEQNKPSTIHLRSHTTSQQ